MSFVANRNHDFSGSTVDFKNKKDVVKYTRFFFLGKLQRLRIWIYSLYPACLFCKCRSGNEVLSLVCI